MKQSLIFLWSIFLSLGLSAQQASPSANSYQSALSLYQQGNYRLAYDHIKTTIQQLETDTLDRQRFDAYLLKYLVARSLYKKRTALKTILTARDIHLQHLPETYRQKELLSYLGAAHAMADQFDEAALFLNQAIPLLQTASSLDSSLLALVYFSQAIFPHSPQEKSRLNNLAMTLIPRDGVEQVYLKGQLIRRFGNISQSRTDYEQAISYYLQELELYQRSYAKDHFDIATAHYNLGNVYYHLLEYRKALDHYHQAYPTWSNRFKPKDAYMRFLNEAMGDLYFELGEKTKALDYYNRSVEGEQVLDRDSSQSMTIKGTAYLQQGQLELAMQYYEQALQFRERNFGKMHPLSGACNNFIARVYRNKGQIDEALATYQQSLIRIDPTFADSNINMNPAISRANSMNPYFLEALTAKASLFFQKFKQQQQMHHLEMAFYTFQQCIQIIDWIRQSPITENAKLYWTEQAFPVYEQAIEAALLMAELKEDIAYLYSALDISEKSKSFLLLSSLHEQEIHRFAGLPESLVDQERSIRSEMRLYQGKVASEEKRCSEMRTKQLGLWMEKILELKRAHDDFLHILNEEYPDYYQLKYDISTTDIRSYQQQLKDQHKAVLEFFEGERKGYIFVLTSDTLHVHTYKKDTDYIQQLQLLRSCLSKEKDDADTPNLITETAYALYQKLLAQALEDLHLPNSVSRLVIIPDGQLAYLPFECLLTTPVTADQRNYAAYPYLLRAYAISYGQSIRLLEKSQARSSSPVSYRYPLLGLAPAYDSSTKDSSFTLSPLLYNQHEVEQAVQLMGGKAIVETSASREAFINLAPEAGIIHLALHAQASDQFPLLSNLYFAGEASQTRSLQAYELYDLQLNAQLTVLSACNTGTGQWVRGEGIMSLSRCFQYAGCPSILTSLWTIDDQSTAELMLHFYQAIQSGTAKDQALQQAKLKYLETADPATAHPAYWAAFILIGNTQPLHFEANRTYWLWGVGLLLIGFALIGIYRKRK